MTDESWADLVDRFVDGDVTPGHMFGCAGLRTGRRFFTIRWHGQLVLKLPPARPGAAGRGGPGPRRRFGPVYRLALSLKGEEDGVLLQSNRLVAAHLVSSLRLDSCSLRSTFEAWDSTVFTEMNSREPISR